MPDIFPIDELLMRLDLLGPDALFRVLGMANEVSNNKLAVSVRHFVADKQLRITAKGQYHKIKQAKDDE